MSVDKSVTGEITKCGDKTLDVTWTKYIVLRNIFKVTNRLAFKDDIGKFGFSIDIDSEFISLSVVDSETEEVIVTFDFWFDYWRDRGEVARIKDTYCEMYKYIGDLFHGQENPINDPDILDW